jgi:hypothetical protein
LAGDAPVAENGDTPDHLSIAIELKLLLPVLKHGAEDSGFPGDARSILMATEEEEQNDDVQSLIRRTHESVALTISQHAATPVQQQSVTLHDIDAAQRLERDYWETHWIVKKANSALPTESENARGNNYTWVPVEVCSPKQRWNENDGLGNLLRDLSAVVHAITQNHRVTVNYTCDVHVHVGRADGEHLSLRTCKRLATMLWLSEDIIRSIRDQKSPNYNNVFTWGAAMTKHSRLAEIIAPGLLDKQLGCVYHSLSVNPFVHALCHSSPAIYAIWNADSHLGLGRLLSGSTLQYRRLGFNFSCLGEEDARAKNGPKTIEFRVLEGTLDTDIVSTWVSICWKFIEVAGASDQDGRFTRVMKTCLDDANRKSLEQHDMYRGRGFPCNTADAEHTREQSKRLSKLKALAVDGLGIAGHMYDAFIMALLSARGT